MNDDEKTEVHPSTARIEALEKRLAALETETRQAHENIGHLAQTTEVLVDIVAHRYLADALAASKDQWPSRGAMAHACAELSYAAGVHAVLAHCREKLAPIVDDGRPQVELVIKAFARLERALQAQSEALSAKMTAQHAAVFAPKEPKP